MLTGLTALFAQVPTASAWSNSYDPLQGCNELAQLSFVNPFTGSQKDNRTFNEWMSQANNGNTPTPNANYDIDYDNPDHSYVLIGNNLSDYVLAWEYTAGENIEFQPGTGSTRRLRLPAGTNQITFVQRNIVPGQGFFDDYPFTWDLSSSVTTQGLTDYIAEDDTQCIHKAHNVTYDPGYDGKDDYFDHVDEVEFAGDCGITDVACKADEIFNGIIGAFANAIKGLIDFIIAIFVPDTDSLMTAIGAIGDSLTESLGFLLFPITWLVDTLTGMINQGATTGGINLGVFFGATLIVDFQAPLQDIGWFSGLFLLAKAGIVLELMFLLWHKYMEVVKG